MSNRPAQHPDRVYTGQGLINDIEANLLKVCRKSFEENESLSRQLNAFPKEWHDYDPNKISNVEGLPALYVWCDGFKPTTPSVGAMSGNRLNQHLAFYCNVQYILPLIEDAEGDRIMKEIAWSLFEDVTRNQNLYDLIDGNTEIYEVTTYPDLKFVGDTLRQVSNVSLKIIYPFQRRTKMSTR